VTLPERPSLGDREDWLNGIMRPETLPERLPNHPDWDRPGWGNRPGFDDWYHNHDHWHNGWWHHPWRPPYCWGYWWDRYPYMTALGLTSWAVNRASWAFGYNSYYNPYADGVVYVDNSVYDYSQPLVLAPGESTLGGDPAAIVEEEIPAASLTAFDQARQEFYSGNFQSALALTNEALKDNPYDAVIHEFRALTLFAMGEFKDSAATLHAVLSVGPGWDWTTMIGLYPDVATYTKHLRALEAHVGKNPDEIAGLLVLSYHYVTAGHDDAAASQLRRLIKLTPSDPVAIQMLLDVDPDAELPTPPQEIQPPKPTAAVKPEQVRGKWQADREGRQFVMELKDDDTFSWSYRDGDKTEEVTGVWSVSDDGVLAMQMNDQGVMLAQLLPQGDGKLDFYMIGDTQGEPPLNFVKQ
jgi:tetratricopeptide (TPR) repeat protein